MRRGITTCQLTVGDQLPPAVELAEALSVDRNTVLAAYRQLRSDGILEFRRGRGVHVARGTSPQTTVVEAAQELIKVGSAHGLDQDQLIQLIRELT